MDILKAAFGKLALIRDFFLKQSLIKKIVIIAVVGAIGWFGVRPAIVGSRQQEIQYQTAQAEKGTLITSVTASGTVSQGSSVSITTQATGIVKQVYVKDGDVVTAGQKIAELTLDTSSKQKQMAALASYQQAKNTVASAKNNLNTLQSNLFAANQIFINDAVARSLATNDPTYIQQNANWLATEGAYKNQQGVITAAQTSASSAWLSYTQLSPTVTSPMSGKISGLSLSLGSAVSTSLGTIVSEQGAPQANISLTEIDVVKVKPGQKVTLTLDALPDKTFTGTILAVNTNGSVSSGVTTYPATISFDTSVDTIYPNMAVNASIITEVKNNVILVPSGAVQISNGATTVRVMKDGSPRFAGEAGQVTSVPVEVGDSNDTQTEIVSGINEGDTVVTGQTGATTTGSATSPFGNTRGGFGGSGGPGGGQFIQRR